MSKVTAVLTILLLSTPAFAKEKPKEKKPAVSLEFTNDFYSLYFFRGFSGSEGPVYQPSATLGYKGLSFTAWMNYDIHNVWFNELDLVLGYYHNLKGLNIGFGYMFVKTFHNSDMPYTQELFVDVSYQKMVWKMLTLKPGMKVMYDFGNGTGLYAELYFGYEAKFTDWLSFAWKGTFGYNHDYFREGIGFSHFHVEMRLPFKVCKHFTIAPVVAASKSLEKKDFPDAEYFGLSLKFNN